MTTALAQTRQRYEATPRQLDDDLQRMARGDRGCLGDAIAGAGALGLIAFGILGYLGFGGLLFTVLSAAMLIGGFALSAVAQARSGPIRRQAVLEGPLVQGRVLRADPALYQPGDASYPALVVFALDPERRFDAGFVHALAERLLALRGASPVPPDQAAAAAMLDDPNAVAPLRLPPSLAGDAEAYMAVISVDPRRLPDKRLTDGLVTLIASPAAGFAEHV